MRFLAGWATGVATVWAALAIWRTLPGLDPECCPHEPDGDPDVTTGRPGYHDSVARG